MRVSYLEIDLDAIESNVRATLAALRRSCRVMAVVKANAYGHGLLEASEACLRAGASWLCVALAEEGVLLREEGITAPILVLGSPLPAEAEAVVRYELSQTVCALEQVRALAQAARRAGLEARVQVKVDTGMGRLGIPPAKLCAFLAACGEHRVRVDGVWSHLATADEEDDAFALEQFRRLQEALAPLRRDPAKRLVHMCNSAGLLRFPQMHLGGVRPGLLVYGVRATQHEKVRIACTPALSLRSRVNFIKRCAAGSSLSYGRTFVTRRPSLVATIPVGYGDGYSRALSNRGWVLIGGRRAPIAGRVCMDQFLVDVTEAPKVRPGDEVVLIGRQGRAQITANEVAAWSSTIVNDTLSAFSARLPRVFLRRGRSEHSPTRVSPEAGSTP